MRHSVIFAPPCLDDEKRWCATLVHRNLSKEQAVDWQNIFISKHRFELPPEDDRPSDIVISRVSAVSSTIVSTVSYLVCFFILFLVQLWTPA
jgi:hypothetical protein